MNDPTQGFDLQGLLAQAAAAQEQLRAAQDRAAAAVAEGRAGGGAVTVRVTGAYEFQAVHIDPSVVDPAEVELLEDLVLAALHDAMDRLAALQRESMAGLGDIVEGLAGPLGLDVPDVP